MSLVFVDREPTSIEIEQFRLVLSTHQDGSGRKPKSYLPWMKVNNLVTLPDGRDFERSVALIFNGIALESKHVYDVLLQEAGNSYVGISCKMKQELGRVRRRNQAYMELTNAAGELWANVERDTGLDKITYLKDPAAVGKSLIKTVENWHKKVAETTTRRIDISKSFFLTLQYDEDGNYQLFQFPLKLPDAESLTWSIVGDENIRATDSLGIVFDWYPSSGGQFKFYPHVDKALWKTEEFRLEPLPNDLTHILTRKAESYFPYKWQQARQNQI